MMKKILNNLREDVTASLSNNLGLKIIAVLFAIFLWWTVVNIDDPIQTKKYVVDVTVTNPQIIEVEGKSFQVDENSKQVTVTVEARRKVIEQIKVSSIVATADMRERQESSVPVRVSITGFEGAYVSAKPFPQNIQVTVEETQEKEIPITASVRGKVRDGYMVAQTTVSPQTVEISGPESIVKKISKVVAQVDVSGLAASRDITTNLVYYDAADNEIKQTYLTSNCDTTGVDVHVKVWKTKIVNIAFDTSRIKAASGHLFNGIEYEPKTIEIAANTEMLNELTKLEIPAEALSRDGIKETEKVIVDISQYLPEGVILVDPNATNVAVEIVVEKFGTKSFSIPVRSVRIDGLDEKFQLAFGPEQSVTIVFTGRSEHLEALTNDGFVASIDLTGFADPGEYVVPVLVAEQPEGCDYDGEAKINVIISLSEDASEGGSVTDNIGM